MKPEGRTVEAPPSDAISGLKATGWRTQCSFSTFSPSSTPSKKPRPDWSREFWFLYFLWCSWQVGGKAKGLILMWGRGS